MNARGPVQVRASVLSLKKVGAYHHLTLVAPGIPERTRPGHFVTLAVGGPDSALLLRRAFSAYRVRASGAYGGTLEIVFAVRGDGTRQLAALRQQDEVDVVGPLGRPFALPKEPVSCVLVGSGHGSAALFTLAARLQERECSVHMVVGAPTEEQLFGALEARRSAQSVTVTTEDGSVGIRGPVTGPLPDLLARTGSELVYASAPVGTLGAVAELAAQHGAWSQCTVETPMACGIGVCMSCVLPVLGDDGITRLLRGCVDGPVFRGDRVRWEAAGA